MLIAKVVSQSRQISNFDINICKLQQKLLDKLLIEHIFMEKIGDLP